MKTYLFDTINRYKRFSENLDVKTILCNKSWWVFNDSGEKEVYIFQADGSLIISVSGKVTNATWQYIAANKSLVISGNNQSYMVHPAFMDNVLFALQVDGTNDVAFLIDENLKKLFLPKSFSDIQAYFLKKEQQEKDAKQQQLYYDQQSSLKIQKENRKEEAIRRIKKETGYKKLKRKEIIVKFINFILLLSSCFAGPFIFGPLITNHFKYLSTGAMLLFMLLPSIILVIIIFLLGSFTPIRYYLQSDYSREYIDNRLHQLGYY